MSETLHRCGCVTRWDLIGWRSVAVKRCDGHTEQERLAERAVAGSATATESHYWCTKHNMPHRDSNLRQFKGCTLVGPYFTHNEAVEWAAVVESATSQEMPDE